jgi:hypothetical protein
LNRFKPGRREGMAHSAPALFLRLICFPSYAPWNMSLPIQGQAVRPGSGNGLPLPAFIPWPGWITNPESPLIALSWVGRDEDEVRNGGRNVEQTSAHHIERDAIVIREGRPQAGRTPPLLVWP